MGVGFSHGKAQWSYTGFSEFRRRLARAHGIELSVMQGWDDGDAPWTIVDSPLVPLLTASDEKSSIAASDCEACAAAIEGIVSTWNEWYDSIDKENGLKLADGMRQCARLGVPFKIR